MIYNKILHISDYQNTVYMHNIYFHLTNRIKNSPVHNIDDKLE